jgi:hypothetical protein
MELVAGDHPEWGKNGSRWWFSLREEHGGTAEERAREYAQRWVYFLLSRSPAAPVRLDPEDVRELLA